MVNTDYPDNQIKSCNDLIYLPFALCNPQDCEDLVPEISRRFLGSPKGRPAGRRIFHDIYEIFGLKISLSGWLNIRRDV